MLATEIEMADNPGTVGVGDEGILFHLTDRLYRATSKPEVFDAALEAVCTALRCERASILLFDENGSMRFVAWRGLSDAYRRAVDGHTPWQPDQRETLPIYVTDVRETAEPAWLKNVLASEGICALAFVPIEAHGQVVGKFMSYYSTPNIWTKGENDIAVTIARQVGFVTERWRSEEARRRAEQSLRSSEVHFRMMTEDAPVMIWTCNQEGHCTHLNRRLREFWGVDESEIETFRWDQTVHPDEGGRIGSAMAQALATRSSVSIRGRYLSADKSYRVLQTQAQPNYGADGLFLGMIGVNIDDPDQSRIRIRTDRAGVTDRTGA